MKGRISNGYFPSLGRKADLLFEDGRIVDIVDPGKSESSWKTTFDADNKWVIPGCIDMHVHLREPGFEWKETILSGVTAAIAGGFTTVCAMPNTNPVNDSAEVTQYILDQAKKANLARVFPIGAISVGLKGKELSPLMELKNAGCCAFSDDGEPVWDSKLMRKALEYARDSLFCLHEEDIRLSDRAPMNESPRSFSMGLIGQPTIAEEVMIARDIEIARYTGGRIHICHVSTARGVLLIERAKHDGINVTAEVTPHHLLLTEEMVEGYNTNAKMAPPLRSREDTLALQKALASGVIDVVASDHAPHERDRKECEFNEAAFGILGLQTTIPLLLELVGQGVLTEKRFVEVLSENAAQILRRPEVGSFSKGAYADITVLDPEVLWEFKESDIKSLSFNSPFIGRTLKGKVTDVFVGGEKK